MNPYNALDIPNVAGPLMTACGYLTIPIGTFLLVTQILNEQKKVVEGERPSYFSVLFNAFLVIIGFLFMYRWVFLKIVSICEYIGWSLGNANDWERFILQSTDFQAVQLSVFKLNLTAFLTAFFSNILAVISGIFYTVRYLILTLLYAVGPLAFASALSPMTKNFFKNWFMEVFKVSFWVVLFSGMQGILSAVNVDSLAIGDATLAPIVVGIVVTIFTVMIPSITSSLLSNGNLSGMGGQAFDGFSKMGRQSIELIRNRRSERKKKSK